MLFRSDTGTSFLGSNIASNFTRNNISFGQDYSASIQVHRLYPEVYGTGNINITVGGADSVASTPSYETTVSLPIVNGNPWAQIDQNAYRVNSLTLSNESNLNTWLCSATTWQYTEVEDDR